MGEAAVPGVTAEARAVFLAAFDEAVAGMSGSSRRVMAAIDAGLAAAAPLVAAAERERILADAREKSAMCYGCDVFKAFIEDLSEASP